MLLHTVLLKLPRGKSDNDVNEDDVDDETRTIVGTLTHLEYFHEGRTAKGSGAALMMETTVDEGPADEDVENFIGNPVLEHVTRTLVDMGSNEPIKLAGLTKWIRQQLNSTSEKLCFKSIPSVRNIFVQENVYFQTITDLRLATDLHTKKSRHQYYLLLKYELLQCGDVEKLINKRQSPEERPVYYATIEDYLRYNPEV